MVDRKKRNYNSHSYCDLNSLRNNKFFKVLLGSYCILMKYTVLDDVEEFVETAKDDYDLIIEFLKFISGQEIEEQPVENKFDIESALKIMGTDS